MKSRTDVRSLDVKGFAKANDIRSYEDALADFPRLMEETEGRGGDRLVRWRAVGEVQPAAGQADQVWLHLTAAAQVPLVCQRCLEPVDIDLSVDRSFRFVADEATAEAEDDESEEDLLVLEKTFDLAGLVEDELLMELPLVPRHDVCPTEVQLQVEDPGFEQAEADKPNPFAALAGLKSKTGKSQG